MNASHRTNYFLLQTESGYVGYWNGDLLAGRGLSTNVPRALALTFETPFEAALWIERLATQDVVATVVDRDGEDMTAAIADAITPCPVCGMADALLCVCGTK